MGLEPVELSDHNTNRYPILRGPVINVIDTVARPASCTDVMA